jgi:chromosome segregation ATPase
MRRRGVVWILLVALGLASGCATVAERSAGSGPVLRGSLGQSRVRSVRMQLGHAQDRIRELEEELAEISSGQGGRVAAMGERERQLTAELARTRQEADTLRADLEEARAVAAAATAAADRPGASPQIASMQVELDTERARRQEAEEELSKLREETSTGPFDSASPGSQAALQEAQAEIDRLNAELARERRQRTDIEQRFAELQLMVAEQPAAAAAEQNPEIAELEQDQRRLMAAIQQDLEASQRREQELRATIATLQEGGGAQLTEAVRDLRAENTALQASLDAEHERNVELAAKLEVATRVADLIFKMRREGRLPDAQALDEAVAE